MTANQQPEDFFNLMEKEQQIADPFASDEILFRDTDGVLKVLKNGEVVPATDSAESSVPAPTATPSDISPQADAEIAKIIEESHIHFNDEDTERRFKTIVLSRLRGVRNAVQTQEAFIRAMADGGMGFDEATAQRMLAIVNKHHLIRDDGLHQQSAEKSFADLQAEANALLKSNAAIARDVAKVAGPSISAIPAPAAAPTVVKPSNYFDASPARPLTPVSRKLVPAAASPKPVPEAVTQPASPERERGEPLPPKPAVVAKKTPPAAPVEPVAMPRPMTSPDPYKPKVQDVKFEPKLTGPVEEIRSMTLTDFRRLASTPQDAIEKVLEKIQLLEEESFGQKVAAIRAWKENEVNRLYLVLGNQSMEQQQSLTDIIAQREAAGQPTLTSTELEAVFELNKKLRRY